MSFSLSASTNYVPFGTRKPAQSSSALSTAPKKANVTNPADLHGHLYAALMQASNETSANPVGAMTPTHNVMDEFWSHIQLCTCFDVNRFHNRLVEKVPLHSPTQYNPDCGYCFKDQPNKDTVVWCVPRGALPAGAGIDHLRSIRDTYRGVAKEMDDYNESQTRRRQVGMSFKTNDSLALRVRDAWTTYSALVFDVVRPAVFREKSQHTPKTLEYVEFMQDYVDDYNKMNKTSSAIPRLPCLTHSNARAHMLPINNGSNCYVAYSACMMCPIVPEGQLPVVTEAGSKMNDYEVKRLVGK